MTNDTPINTFSVSRTGVISLRKNYVINYWTYLDKFFYAYTTYFPFSEITFSAAANVASI